MGQIDVMVGAQWGDEGKGKWVDILADDYDLIARFQGGPNAGHTIYLEKEVVVLHQLPSGVFHPGKKSVLLSGVTINPAQIKKEMEGIVHLCKITPENLWVSERAHVISPYHIFMDELREKSNPIGTTKRGIGPTYADKVSRSGLLMGLYVDATARQQWIDEELANNEQFRASYEAYPELWREFIAVADAIKPFVCDAEAKVRAGLSKGQRVLLEGAQGTMLDINHGTYPYVTASSTTVGGGVSSLGAGLHLFRKSLGIAKAYATRVGDGPFPSELFDDVGRMLAERGNEVGATTGRARRCGWFDAVAMRYATDINGFTGIYVNKLDILSGLNEVKIAVAYEHPTLGRLNVFPALSKTLADCKPVYETFPGWTESLSSVKKWDELPQAAKNYLRRLESLCGTKLIAVGNGPRPSDVITVPEA